MDQQLVEGMTVYDAAGEQIGTLGDNAGPGYLDVRKGWLFPKDFYVPVGAVQRSGGDGVYLSISKDELLHNPQYDLAYDQAYDSTATDDTLDQSDTTVSGTTAGDTGAAPTRGYSATDQAALNRAANARDDDAHGDQERR